MRKHKRLSPIFSAPFLAAENKSAGNHSTGLMSKCETQAIIFRVGSGSTDVICGVRESQQSNNPLVEIAPRNLC